jgi:hypothetical protein
MSGARGIFGHQVVTMAQEGEAGAWWRRISRSRRVAMR